MHRDYDKKGAKERFARDRCWFPRAAHILEELCAMRPYESGNYTLSYDTKDGMWTITGSFADLRYYRLTPYDIEMDDNSGDLAEKIFSHMHPDWDTSEGYDEGD